MIYLIGGAPRVGKSQLALKLIELKPMPLLSCDFLYDLSQIKDLENFDNAAILEKGRLFYPTLKEILINMSCRTQDCVIEGEVILPEQISELSKLYDIRACFIGLSDTNLETIITHGGSFNWPQWKIEDGLGHEVQDLAERTVSRSLIIEEQAKDCSLPYFDLTDDYISKVRLALHSLQIEK
jgi:hypothetical protein